MSLNKIRGNFGEDYVCCYLSENGAEIVQRNFRTKYGEIDIIAEDEKTLMIVEVKTRKPNSLVAGINAVTWTKQNRIVITTEFFLMKNKFKKPIRFDVADLVVSSGANPTVLEFKYWKNAFNGNDKGIYTIK